MSVDYAGDTPWAGAWRAHQSTAYGFPSRLARQTETFTQMLSDGIRWLHLIIDYCDPGATSGALCLCRADDACDEGYTLLDDRLLEIAAWMTANPTAIVTLYLEEFVANGALEVAVANSGLSPMLFPSWSGSNYEPFLLDRREMATKNRRLVIFGGSFLSLNNVFLATEFEVDTVSEGDPRLGTSIFNPGNAEIESYQCLDGDQRAPEDLPGFGGLYVLRHGTDKTGDSWAAAACQNEWAAEHVKFCEERHQPVTAILVDFYNSSGEPLQVAGFDNAFESRCEWAVDSCWTDDDCDSGHCGGLFICLNCENDDDCPLTQHCDHYLGACLADLTDGTICLEDEDCASGNCSFLCYSCESDADCEASEWCNALGACKPKKLIGQGCFADRECMSEACYAGACAACDDQADCGDGEYCKLSLLAGASACVEARAIGQGCFDDFECASGNCWALTCSECDAHADCASTEYCTLDSIAPVVSECVARVADGVGCATNVECLSGRCVTFVCAAACTTSADCETDQYCRSGGTCADQGEIGHTCLSPEACLSGACRLGFCVECDGQEDCGASEYCTLSVVAGASACEATKANGAGCLSDVECTSDNCWAATCSACDEQGDCAADQYCTLDVIPPINSTCKAKKTNGSACATSVECDSDQCTAFICGECASDADCSAAEHCNALNNCAPDLGNNAVCLRDAFCQSGICSAGLCAECRDDGGCPAAEHCDAFGDCHDDVGNNAPCLRHAVCASGICSAGFCAECVSDVHCPAAEHCDAFGDCHNDVGNNAPCLRNAVCSTGICSAGFCAECTSASHCAGDEFCNAGGDCAPKVGDGTACTSGGVCLSGCCGLFVCGGPGC